MRFSVAMPTERVARNDSKRDLLKPRERIVVGVIADTHGLLRPEACAALAGSDLIVHAGDIGDPKVLDGLAEIAPVHAVRGNNDHGAWALKIDETAAVEVGGRWLYVLHDLHALDLDPRAAGFDAVIAGHSHRPLVEERRGVLYVNPGSAGPRRFKLPIALARLRVDANGLSGEILEIPPRTSGKTELIRKPDDLKFGLED